MQEALQPVIGFQALSNRNIGQKRRIRRYFRPISGQIFNTKKLGLPWAGVQANSRYQLPTSFWFPS